MGGLYDRYILPRLVDAACGHRRVADQRARIVPLAEGVVVELGIGSGHNLDHYDPARVRRLIGVDRAKSAWLPGRERFARAPVEIELIEAGAEALDLPPGLADTVVVTYALCSIGDVAAALSQARRVLKPTGRLLFVEHGRAPDAALALWQARLTPLTRMFAGGCHLDRDPAALIAGAGFAIERIDAGWAAGFPRMVSYHYAGSARPG